MNCILDEKQAKYVEERSKFLAFTFDVKDKSKVAEILENLKSKHPSCRHMCYAYRFFDGDVTERACDDGEPSGTAGAQILQLLREMDVINVLCVVIRYFGGVKLGTANLGRAYKETARQTLLDNLKVVEQKKLYAGECDYQLFSHIKQETQKRNIVFEKVSFDNNVKFEVYLSDRDYNWLNALLNLKAIGKTCYS